MNKKYIAINALILCVGLGIILGLIYEKKNTKSEKIDTNNTNEYTEKINETEKDLEESNEKYEKYRKFLKEEQKKSRELLDIIERANFEDDGYQYIVDAAMDGFYRYAFTMHALPYCGEHSENAEYIDNGKNIAAPYYESYTFENIKDVKEFFTKYLSEKYYNENIEKYYLEKDNKLHCYAPGKGTLIYQPEKSDFKVITTSDSKIEVFAKTISENIGTDTGIDAYATLIYENGNWVVDQYKEY